MRNLVMLALLFAACNQDSGASARETQLQMENMKLVAANGALLAEIARLKSGNAMPSAGDRADGGEPAAEEADDPLDAAQRAYADGDFAKALALARKQPPNMRTWRIIGASACYLKDEATAADARKHLNKDNQKFVTYVCQRNGLK